MDSEDATGQGLAITKTEGTQRGTSYEIKETTAAANKSITKLGDTAGTGNDGGSNTIDADAVDAAGHHSPVVTPSLAMTTSSHATTTSTDTGAVSVFEELKFTKPISRGQPGSRDEEDNDNVLLGTKTLNNFNPIDTGESLSWRTATYPPPCLFPPDADHNSHHT